jgi:hypothetical protein
MRTGWLLDVSPSDHYWWRYEVGQWFVFGWFWGWGTLDMQLARRKWGKKNTSQSWRPPSPYGRHGTLLPEPPHKATSQHAARQVYVINTRKYSCFYYLLAILRHDASSTHCWCAMPVCLRVTSAGSAESIILSAGGVESMMLSTHAESMDTHSAGAENIILTVPPAESMILSALFVHVIMLR